MKNPRVTIVGAGPIGLLSAVSLTASGIPVRIIESKKAPSILSRALAVHAGTLELLEFVHPELLRRFLARGKKIHLLEFGEKYKIDVSLIPSKFNFVLVLEQQETEEILQKYLSELGVEVEWGCALIDAKEHDEKVVCEVENAAQKFFIESEYVIDCSGAHSVIRKNVLKLSFHGEKYLGRLVMGDVKIKSSQKEDRGHVMRNENGIAGIIPLNHPQYFRVILIPQKLIEIPQEITISFFKKLTKSIAPQVELSEENKWLTSFEISKRLVSKLRVGRIFLAGDAAHVHSPVGGQGMNLGMQDSFNLCHKLQKVLVGGADEKILDDYEKERMPVIKDVLKLTNAAMRSGVERSRFSAFLFSCLQKIFAPLFFKSKFLQKIMCTKMSQIKSARREIARMKISKNAN